MVSIRVFNAGSISVPQNLFVYGTGEVLPRGGKTKSKVKEEKVTENEELVPEKRKYKYTGFRCQTNTKIISGTSQ